MTKALGKNQQGILNALREHKRWSPGCGWVWGGRKTAMRLLDALVARGLAEKKTFIYRNQQGLDAEEIVYTPVYEPAPAHSAAEEIDYYDDLRRIR